MSEKILPFSDDVIESWVTTTRTPFYVYDRQSIVAAADRLNDAFSWVGDVAGAPYVNYFAVKATPTPAVMRLLHEHGMGFDSSSHAEVILSNQITNQPDLLMFSSNNTDPAEYKAAIDGGFKINLDDINQIDSLLDGTSGSFPETISFRYNPGSTKDSGVNTIIGRPEDAKFGVPDDQLTDAYDKARDLGAKRFGLHTMLASNEVTVDAHATTARLMFEKAVELKQIIGIEVEEVNLGGGLGIDYHPEDAQINVEDLAHAIKDLYQEILVSAGLNPRLTTEYGRFVTGPHGYLVTKVRSVKETYKRYVGLDATMADLMRPGMYDSYHHITVVGKNDQATERQAVVGSLCENNDFFTGSTTMTRELPRMEQGDIVIIHDAGAHGHAMGFNYNGKLRPAEYLANKGGKLSMIRRRQTLADIFSALEF